MTTWYISILDEKTGVCDRMDMDMNQDLPLDHQIQLARQNTVLIQAANYPSVKMTLWCAYEDGHRTRYSEFYGSMKRNKR